MTRSIHRLLLQASALRVLIATLPPRLAPPRPEPDSLARGTQRRQHVQRHVRVENDAITSKVSMVEIAAKGVERQVAPKEEQRLQAFALETSRRGGFKSDAADYGQSKEYDADNTNALSKDQWTSFQPPAYPCLWNVQISRADKGSAKVWRTVTVKGRTDDAFHFQGCSTQGEEAFVCQHSEGVQGGVRLMRNTKGEVIGFGSCCKANMVDAVVASRIGACEAVPSNVTLKANATAWLRSAADALAPTLPLQSTDVMLKVIFVLGMCLLVAISSTIFVRFKR